jgi:hypothetical protein
MSEIKLELCAICLGDYPEENNIIRPYCRTHLYDITTTKVKSFESAFIVEADVEYEWQVPQKSVILKQCENSPVMNLFYLETVEERNYNVQLWNNCQDSTRH